MKFRVSLLAVALALTACTSQAESNESDKTSTTTETGESESPPERDEPDPTEPFAVIETDFLSVPFEMSVYPIQSDGDLALVQVDLLRQSAAGQAGGDDKLDLGRVLSRDGARPGKGAEYLRLIDRPAKTVYAVAQDEAEEFAGSKDRANQQLEVGETTSVFAYFSAPTANSIDLDVPHLGYVPNVPVVALADDGQFAVPASEFEVSGQLESPQFSLISKAVDYDEFSSVSEDREYVTWVLASDVLFDYDEHELDKAAKEAVEEAIAEIKELAAAGGEIHLTGHTDDQGSADYNQTLSEKRAASVKEVFDAHFDATYTITSEGKGKLEPVVEGTSEEARAANRRVEIRFAGDGVNRISERGAADPPPETDAPTVSGHEQLEFEVPPEVNPDLVGLTVTSVEELDDEYLLGTVEVELLDTGMSDEALLLNMFANGGYKLGWGMSQYIIGNGAGLLSLATGTANVYPIEYVFKEGDLGGDRKDIIGDPRPLGVYSVGTKYRLNVLWPNPGTDTVTVEVPQRMRFADIPVDR